MKSISAFDFFDYKLFLNAKTEVEWGGVTRAAQAAGCQRSYLSRVIHGSVHLTPDQAFLLSEFWKFSRVEKSYFLTLVESSRACSQGYRQYLAQKLKRIRTENENLARRLERKSIEFGEKEAVYYSSWYWSAVHILVSIPQYQTIRAISQRLYLPESLVKMTLETLERFQLVTKKGQIWVYSSAEIHVPKHSPFAAMHHSNWRQRAVLSAQDHKESGLHFTVAQSISLDAFEKIKSCMLKFIEEASAIAGPSKEDLVCFACDLFWV